MNVEIPDAREPLPMRGAAAAYALLLALALVAFWPGYLALPKAGLSGWLHLHALTSALWMLMLIAQPLAIHLGHRRLHRRIGRCSVVLMPIILVGFVGLAHSAMQGMTQENLGAQAYLFLLRIVLVALFVGPYIMAMAHRHDAPVHARYMVCTGLALIDPVVSRIAFRALGDPGFNYQLLTFGTVGVILVALIWAERHARSGRQVFPAMLVAYFVGALPFALDFYTWGAPWTFWKSVSQSFAALPLT